MLQFLGLDEYEVSIDDLVHKIFCCAFDMGKGKFHPHESLFSASRICIEYFLITFRRFMTVEQLIDCVIARYAQESSFHYHLSYKEAKYSGISQGYQAIFLR